MRMMIDFHALGATVQIARSGSFGVLPSGSATALSMVLTEVVQNAVEHGYPSGRMGRIVIAPTRLPGQIHLTVDDDGVGLPADFNLDDSTHLGLSIVRALVESELSGKLTVETGLSGQGTGVSVVIPID